jgi:hypothetical protein
VIFDNGVKKVPPITSGTVGNAMTACVSIMFALTEHLQEADVHRHTRRMKAQASSLAFHRSRRCACMGETRDAAIRRSRSNALDKDT